MELTFELWQRLARPLCVTLDWVHLSLGLYAMGKKGLTLTSRICKFKPRCPT